MTKQVKFYTKDTAGNNIPLDSNKIYAEFSTGETLTIEVPSQHKINDLVLRTYYGDDEFFSAQPGEKCMSSRMVIAPGATNVVGISVITEEVTCCDKTNS